MSPVAPAVALAFLSLPLPPPEARACCASAAPQGQGIRFHHPDAIGEVLPPPEGREQTLLTLRLPDLGPERPLEIVGAVGLLADRPDLAPPAEAIQAFLVRHQARTGHLSVVAELTPIAPGSLAARALAGGPGVPIPGARWFGFRGEVPAAAYGPAPEQPLALAFALQFTPDGLPALASRPVLLAAGAGDGRGAPAFGEAFLPFAYLEPAGSASCVPTQTALCLGDDRFRVTLNWRSRANETPRPARVAACRSGDSGLFYFNNPDNWESLIKIVNACSLNDRYWVFHSATTNVDFALTVTDVERSQAKTYTNPLGRPAMPIQDVAAFATCP